MILNRLSLRERGLSLATIVVIGCALGYVWVVEPLWTRLDQLHQSMAAETMRLQKYRRLLTERDRIQKQFVRMASQSTMKGSEEEVMTDFLSQVERMAEEASLTLKGLRPRPVGSLGRYRIFVVDVSTEGSIGPITRFLHELQVSPHLVKVDRMQLAVKSGTIPGLLEAQLTLSTLRLPAAASNSAKPLS